MILTHKKKFCEIGSTKIFRAPVFKQQLKNITPNKIYTDNMEFFAAFGDTVANFSPVSLNIVDYWNKTTRTHDTHVWHPIGEPPEIESFDPAFGWLQSENHGFKNSKDAKNPDGVTSGGKPQIGGFPKDQGDGRLLGQQRRGYLKGGNENIDGSCRDDNLRFFINPLIGIQDKLAMTYLNNFYSVYYNARQNPTLRHRLLTIAQDPDNNFNPNEFFGKPNNLFTEEKTVANKTFIQKKGTAVGLKYAQKSAYDAELQGKMSRFYMKIKTPAPLEYNINSNILEDIFEKFVKPLAHPIGFIYDYKAVCMVQGAEDVDNPMINHTYFSDLVEVNCLCKHKKSGHLLAQSALMSPSKTEEEKAHVDCINSPKSKVFALGRDSIQEIQDPKYPNDPTKKIWYQKGLWSGIEKDAYGRVDYKGDRLFNVLVDYKMSYGKYRDGIHKYKKYFFENGNYLIAWFIQSKVQDMAPEVIIEYYRRDYNSFTGTVLVTTFKNNLHCSISDNLQSDRKSQITEEFVVGCRPSHNGPFIMDVQGKNASGKNNMVPITKPDVIGQDPQGKDVIQFRGFITTYNGKIQGGKLVGYSVFKNITIK